MPKTRKTYTKTRKTYTKDEKNLHMPNPKTRNSYKPENSRKYSNFMDITLPKTRKTYTKTRKTYTKDEKNLHMPNPKTRNSYKPENSRKYSNFMDITLPKTRKTYIKRREILTSYRRAPKKEKSLQATKPKNEKTLHPEYNLDCMIFSLLIKLSRFYFPSNSPR